MTLELVIPLVLLFLLLALGMPVALAMGAAATVGLVMVLGWDSTLAAAQSVPYQHTTSFTLTTVPLFILMAEFLSQGKIIKDVFAAASAWWGGIRGGLAMATVTANAGFAALSGSSTAAVASMARITVPEMRQARYDDRLALGTVAASGTLAAMIPPSGAMIIYGALTQTSIAGLFMAGIVPGLLTAVGYIITIAVWARYNPNLAPRFESPGNIWRLRLTTSLKVWPGVLLVVLVLGGIYSGALTPTEAGAVGALGGLVVSILFGGMRWRGVIESVRRTVQVTAMIFLLIVGATLVGTFITVTRVTQNLLEVIANLGLSATMVVIIIMVVYLILGMFMDVIAMMVLTLPITFPLIVEIGYSPIWFGIVVIKCAEIGLITPPFGLNVFVANGAVTSKIGTIFAGTSRFLVTEVALLVLFVAVPGVAMMFSSAGT